MLKNTEHRAVFECEDSIPQFPGGTRLQFTIYQKHGGEKDSGLVADRRKLYRGGPVGHQWRGGGHHRDAAMSVGAARTSRGRAGAWNGDSRHGLRFVSGRERSGRERDQQTGDGQDSQQRSSTHSSERWSEPARSQNPERI